MKKQDSLKEGINALGKGVFDLFESDQASDADIAVDTDNNTTPKEDKKPVNDAPKNVKARTKKAEENSEDNKKKKRSFMFTDNTIQKLSLLDLCIEDKDLGEIVTAAIDAYFEQHKEEIKKALKMYSSIK